VSAASDAADARFRQAAWTYFGYGLVYLAVAVYLQLAVFGVAPRLLVWFVFGAVITVGVPWLLARRRAGFERWVLSRRDFARLLAVLVAVRAIVVALVAVHGPSPGRMPAFGGGVPTTAAGAWLMAAVAAVTAVMLVRAAWSREA
jgi:hypothetical protein